MGFVIGKGRKASETYPDKSGGSGLGPGLQLTPWTLTGVWVPPFECFPFTNFSQVGPGGVVIMFGVQSEIMPPNVVKNYQVKITTSGTLGTGKFDLSDDGGATFFLTNQTIPANNVFVVPGRGFSIFFATDAFVAGTLYNGTTVFASLGNGTWVGNFRIVGDSAEIRIFFQRGSTTDFGGGVGTTNSIFFIFPVPPGFKADFRKVPIGVVSAIPDPVTLSVVEFMFPSTLEVQSMVLERIGTNGEIIILALQPSFMDAIGVGSNAQFYATAIPITPLTP